tara:strand:+ start:1148 stop:1699 length:552 start_codon:yes stop_codon:yes gene_type:complete
MALNTIVTAFTADPLLRWMVPDADKYIRYGAALFEAFGGGAFDAHTAFQIQDFAGVALWIPPSHAKHSDERGQGFSQQFLQAVDQARLEPISDVLRGMRAYHPKEECWYLSLIGVDPCHQGRGLGARLMKHALNLCDDDGLPAYLESSNPANIALYERFGFEVMGLIQSQSSPAIHPMIRTAR